VVVRYDGDTISVVRRGHAEKVRLAGIDCPELRQAFGNRAKNLRRASHPGKWYGPCPGLRRLWSQVGRGHPPDGRSLNRELVAAGLAWKVKTSKNKQVAQLERDARRAKRGLWADADPTPPWEYRKVKNAER
jgi:endonuclease YncB( thermonuclease family)